ncbi:MAG: DUF362 domain-containing protein [Spirochaetota bacterium]
MRAKKSFVSVVKTREGVYRKVDFKEMVSQSLTNIEKSNVYVPKNGTVFIKPNVIMGVSATKGITTEPQLVAGLIELLKQRGVKKVFVGDSPASYMGSRQAFESTGMAGAVRESGGEIVNIDDESERVSIRLQSDMLEELSVPRKAAEADFLINFAKLKTHRLGAVTCCVKNWVGFISQDLRLQYHQTRLPKLVAELHRALPEQLCFADGVVIGEGEGPDLNEPRFLGVLLSSNDPVAVDSVGARLLGIHSNELVFSQTAYFEGIGEIERNKIQITGENIEEISIQVKRPTGVLYNRFPCHIILGGMCEGCFAWFIGPALFWKRDNIWQKINQNAGKPTFMIGFNARDVHFEQHLKQGPYFVIGDCAPKKYRDDPRTVYIKGCTPGPSIPEVVLNTCKINTGDQWK